MNKHMVKSKSVTVVILLGLLLVATLGRAEETRTLTNLRGEMVIVPDTVPNREEFALLKMVVVKIETPNGKGGLIFALYGTDASKGLEEANYVELYDLAGNLLQIAWLDKSGQVKVAYDKNLTDPEAKEPAKVLMMGPGPSFVVQRPSLHHF